MRQYYELGKRQKNISANSVNLNHFIRERTPNRRRSTIPNLGKLAVAEVETAAIEVEPLELVPRNLDLGNKEMPITERREEIVQAVLENQVTIIVAPTGTGKSTQVPQYLYDAGFEKVIITQPRRLAAYNNTERIQQEFADTLEQSGVSSATARTEARGLIGAQTADFAASTATKHTKILTVTDGLQLVRELNDRGVQDNEVLIIDEVHEANINIEILMAKLHEILSKNPKLRMVFMSATLESGRLQAYYRSAAGKDPAIVSLKKEEKETDEADVVVENADTDSTKDVDKKDEKEGPETRYKIASLEWSGSTVLDEVLHYARRDETILVFVPGVREIQDTIEALQDRLRPDLLKNAMILGLHGRMKKLEQDRIYQESRGLKIIIATNVAQTSITIPDVNVVIDSGLARQPQLDREGDTGLRTIHVSQDDIVQRRGRTGRTGPGRYVLTKYDEASEFCSEKSRPQHGTAEILRANLEQTVLRTAAAGCDLAQMNLMHPVEQRHITNAQYSLSLLGAISPTGKITAMGEEMSRFNLNPHLARMAIESKGLLARHRLHIAAMTAAVEARGLRDFTYGAGTRWKELVERNDSDYYAALELFISVWHNRDDPSFSISHDLDEQSVTQAIELFYRHTNLLQVDPEALKSFNDADLVELKQCITAGSIDRVYRVGAGGKAHKIQAQDDPRGVASEPRSLSNRSIVRRLPVHKNVSGSPSSYEKKNPNTGQRQIEYIIGNIAVDISTKKLATIYREQVDWELTGHYVKNNQLIGVFEGYFRGTQLNESKEEVIEQTSPATSTFWQEYFLQNPTPNLEILFTMMHEHEAIQERSQTKIPDLLTRKTLRSILRRAIPEVCIYEHEIAQAIDIALERRIVEYSAKFSTKKVKDVCANSPNAAIVGEEIFALQYQKGTPYIKLVGNDEQLGDWALFFNSDEPSTYLPNDVYGRKLGVIVSGKKTMSMKKFIDTYLPSYRRDVR